MNTGSRNLSVVRYLRLQSQGSLNVCTLRAYVLMEGPALQAKKSALIDAAVLERRAVVTDCQFFGALTKEGFAAAGGALLVVWLLA